MTKRSVYYTDGGTNRRERLEYYDVHEVEERLAAVEQALLASRHFARTMKSLTSSEATEREADQIIELCTDALGTT
jgi:hypothetical protein